MKIANPKADQATSSDDNVMISWILNEQPTLNAVSVSHCTFLGQHEVGI